MWVRIDDHVPHHPKFTKAGAMASWLWVCGNCYCNKYLTDGFIEEAALPTLGNVPNVRQHAAKLVMAGLWERVEHGYQVHDFHDHNPRAEQIKQKREQDKLRKRLQAEDGSGSPPPRVRPVEKAAIPLPDTFHSDSIATPQPFHSDSVAVPERSRARADADARDRDPIPSQIPVPSHPVPVHAQSAHAPREPSALAGTLPRDHLRHAWCSQRGKCVPDFLHGEFVKSVGGDEQTAKEALKVFYDTTEAGWPLGPIGDDPIKLWRQAFAAKFPSVTATAVARGKTSGNDAALASFVARGGRR